MNELWKSFVRFFVSLELTVALLALSIVLVFCATIDQVHLGVWGVQEKWFRSFVVLHEFRGFPIPVFPGGYFIGGLLFLNLIAAHAQRFTLTFRKSGLFLTHFGLILLLVGELLSGLWQEDFQLRLTEGETKNFSESYRSHELAIIDTTDPKTDLVVVIPDATLAAGKPVQHPDLPFRVEIRDYYPNAMLQMRAQAPNAPASIATQGIGPQVAVTPLPITWRDDQRNLPTAFVELFGAEGSLGVWMTSAMLGAPQTFSYAGRNWRLLLRSERAYKPYALTLLDFSHDRYMGTDIPKNFSSKIRLESADGKTNREVLIYMNNPLRYDGLTFYQAGFENDDKTTVLQVVRNPSWLLPYIACGLMTLGLVIHFSFHLVGFVNKRRALV